MGGEDRYLRLRKRTMFVVAAVLGLFLVLVVIFYPVWLGWLAGFLVFSEAPLESDAILVLGGGRGDRCAYAAHLYRAGQAPVVVVMGDSVANGRCCSEQDYMGRQLLTLGLPEAAIVFASRSTSTHEEAGNALEVLRRLQARSAMVITDPFHTRRAAATFRKVWTDSEAVARVCAADPSWFRAERWWTREREILAVFGEYEKLIYYWLSGKI